MALMAERARIARFFAPLSHDEPGSFALTDDAALLTPPLNHHIIVTTDSVITGIHVLPNASATQLAEKLVRRNLSDLAAMGARPWRYFLNLHTPDNLDDAWFAEFSATLANEQQRFGMVLAGGDSTSGGERVHATITCIGLLRNAPMRRSTAALGDDLYVSGTIGDAALGLCVLQHRLAMDSASAAHVTHRYHAPEPRLELGEQLHTLASAAMDISDGLLADAAQVAQASGVQLHIDRDAVPLSDAARSVVAQDAALWHTVMSGGDDYELLFTAPAAQRDAIAALGSALALPLTRIGVVVAGSGVTVDGQLAQGGWEHA